MASENNKRRRKGSKQPPVEIWGSFFDTPEAEDSHAQYIDDEPYGRFSWRRFLHRFSLWKLISTLVALGILAFIGSLIFLTWVPQDLSEIQGYKAITLQNGNTPTPDIPTLLKKAIAGKEAVTFTEEDINSYLSTSLKPPTQSGPPLSHPHGVGIRLFDDYAEIVINRTIGNTYNQTVSMYVTVKAGDAHHIRIEYNGGEKILDTFPRGGRLGILPLPEGYTLILLQPAMESLAKAYADIFDLIKSSRYSPVLGKGKITLYPPPAQITTPSQTT